ncbi:ESX secretion-associated protein EspG [Nocardia asteroides]|uniref:ESX secretion-associated protein EspG n=1 Tax=Nocardia asteroides TaxID=1824 RepID=UPI001E5714D2|nr:ESX secretion-associated protein EspG [Nocardia asteroides]UGT53123.1 ESX secretion-associated protein EspG [Nocardia asteroides]
MTDAWELTPFEFWVAWETLGRDRMPWPLTFTSGVETQDEFDQECRHAADSLIAKIGADESLYHALHALAHPELRVELFGHRFDGRTRMVRACAATEAGNGVVAAQIPGAEYGQGANILISLRPAKLVAQRLIAVLPAIPPGRQQGFNVHRDELTEPQVPGSRRTPGELATRFLKRPFRTYAEFRVDLGPALDGWKEGGTRLQIVDYIDDGRYLFREGERVEAFPVTTPRLAAELHHLITQATARTRENAW